MLKNIQRYQVGNQIGQGAMAKVYEAYDPRIDRQLAIKILREDKSVDSEYVMRFLREAKAVGNLSHPHIVTVFDVGEYDSRPFIVMELLEGIPLNVLMQSGKCFPQEDVLTIGIQLASALDYAHSRGIVHRDIKPSNIICSQYDKKVKITDFGIAHFDDTEITQHTRMGDVLGTPQYMPPEQLEGAAIDGRSDLFSVGVIFYQMLTGDRPFKGDSVASLMYQITTVTPKPVSDFDPTIPPSVTRIVQKLLHKDPDKRFQTGKELAEALNNALHNIKDDKLLDHSGKVVPIRFKWSLAMASIVSITMLAGIVFSFDVQYKAMATLMLENGKSLVKFVAAESAIPILSEDWVTLELFAKEAADRQGFEYLTIVDHKNIIRGSNIPGSIGHEFTKVDGAELSADASIFTILKQMNKKTIHYITDFSSPITFQNKSIGVVHLGISQASLQNLAELSIYLMGILLTITIAVVVIFSYVLGRYFTSSINVIRRGLEEISLGRYHHRIEKSGKDEFGQLFISFNEMAKDLQRHFRSNLNQDKANLKLNDIDNKKTEILLADKERAN